MQLLNREKILASLQSEDPNSLFIDPLLEISQIGEVSIDLRLGYDFLVSVQTRTPFIGLDNNSSDYRDSSSYFQPTRRDVGDRFILYPGQIALTTSLEYVSLPDNIIVDIMSRSSYLGLGIHLNKMIQPGFRGCMPLELFNHGNNPIELFIGSRMFQMRLTELSEGFTYGVMQDRKYFGNVRPTTSRAASDQDLTILKKIAERQ